ncbi:MAG: FG-GAP-like repeat-containing protein, partial [Bacteroidota bacterium]
CDPSFLPVHVGYHYLGTYNSQGLPNYLAGRDSISNAFLDMVHKALPERAPVPQYNPKYLERHYDRDIKLKDNAEVWVTFVAEGAGYKNVLGFYVYDTLSPPTSPPAKEDITIIFPNVSAKYSGGELEAGHKVKLGTFQAGQGIGWVLMANGWKNGSVTEGNWTLYSNPDYNPEKDSSLREHNVLLYDSQTQLMILAFEDILRDNSGCDNDFNDAIFYVTANPMTSIGVTAIVSVPESNCSNGIDEDGDGLIDCDDPDCQASSNACVQDEFFTEPTNTGLDVDARSTWGAAWGDYDGDGWEDLLVTEYAHWWSSYLYHNNQDGTFSKVSAQPITTDGGSNVGVSWGDYDNDGDLDLFAANNVRAVNHLYRNDGGGNFTKVSAGDLSNYSGYCHSAAWADYDNDGFLDLFVADFMPTKFNLLYHNEGDGTFTQVNQTPISMEAKSTMSGAWGDYNGDGLIDLFVPQARDANNTLYRNKGNGHFERILTGDIVNDGGNSLGASWADYDNDGDLDLYVSNASNQKNFFYINNGDGTFAKDTSSIVVNEPGHSFGSSWGDVDNDGDLDLFVVNDNGNPNRLYLNEGDGTFSVQYNSVVNTILANSATASFADYDKDGDIDLFVGNNQYQANKLYKNEKGSYFRWKYFKLEGTQSNKSAIGAKIFCKANIYGQSVWQMREISSQTGGVSAQNSLYAHFGLGDAVQIDSVRIIWPSGNVQSLGPQSVDDYQTILEPTGQEVYGTAYVDANNNCQYDFGERLIANLALKVLPDGKALATDKDGRFSFYRTQGSSTIVQDTSGAWNAPCVPSINVQISSDTISNGGGGGSFANPGGLGLEFPNQGGSTLADLNLSISSTALRRGFRNSYALTYFNMSTIAAGPTSLSVEFDKDIIPLSATQPWDSLHDNGLTVTYFWQMDSIPAFEGQTIFVTDSVSATALMGKNTLTFASIGSSTLDMDFSDNTVHDYNTVVGAVDPNDILVTPEGDVAATDSLSYTIRFQNVGTAAAQRVLILDTLSQHLDWASLQIVEVSHEYEMSVSEEGVLRFVFDYIFLADSNSNEPESHGFIRYQILPHADSDHGSLIQNRAAIQFDYSEFLITNTVENRIRSFSFDVQKSGNDAQLIWLLSSAELAGRFEIERSLDGNSFGKVQTHELQIDQTEYRAVDLGIANLPLQTVYYRVKLILDDGRTQYSDVVSLSLKEEALAVFVQGYPNPFGKYLNIQYHNPYNQKVNLRIVNGLGVSIYQTHSLPAEGEVSVDTENWAAGYYYLSLGDGQHKQTFKLQKR